MTWEKIGARIGVFFRGKNVKNAVELTQKAVKISPQTKVFTNSATGVVTYKRPIMYNGKTANATLDTWVENGKKMSKMRIEGEGISTINRTKAITREQGGSVFGGERITIEKNDTKHWCYSESSKLVKDYNKAAKLEHKEYTISHSSGNGLGDWKHSAVQDRVYDECQLTSSVNNMLTNPHQSEYFQHTLDGANNYYKFAVKGTNYTKTVAAKEQAALEAAQKAAREAELAIRPRINVGKVLGVDISNLQRVEKTLADGSIERIYTKPGSDKVLLKTVDKGILHQEWIYGGKADMIYMKQVGEGTPYIFAKKGNSIQLSSERLVEGSDGLPFINPRTRKFAARSDNSLYYYDGLNSVKYDPKGLAINDEVIQIKVPYKFHPDYVNGSESTKKLMDKIYLSNNSKFAYESLNHYGQRVHGRDSKVYYKELFEKVKSNYINLKDLFTPYSV